MADLIGDIWGSVTSWAEGAAKPIFGSTTVSQPAQVDEWGGQTPGATIESFKGPESVPSSQIGQLYSDEGGVSAPLPVEPTATIDSSTKSGGADYTPKYVSSESGIVDMSGGKPSAIITQTTEAPKPDISKYYGDESAITHAAYVKTSDLGDTKTQEKIASGLTPEQALAEQYAGAVESGDTRAASYYENEFKKAQGSNIALSGEYHAAARESGLPQAVNPFENVADISLANLQKLESATPSTSYYNRGDMGTFKEMASLTPQFKASEMLKSANVEAIAERSGDLGDYGRLTSYSSTYGILPLETQQAIGAKAATSPYNAEGQGWEIHPEAMEKFSDKLMKNLGYGTGAEVTEAGSTKGISDWTANKELLGGATTAEKLGQSEITPPTFTGGSVAEGVVSKVATLPVGEKGANVALTFTPLGKGSGALTGNTAESLVGIFPKNAPEGTKISVIPEFGKLAGEGFGAGIGTLVGGGVGTVVGSAAGGFLGENVGKLLASVSGKTGVSVEGPRIESPKNTTPGLEISTEVPSPASKTNTLSWGDANLRKTGVYLPEFKAFGYDVGGQVGSGENIRGQSVYSPGFWGGYTLEPLPFAGTAMSNPRRSKPSHPRIERMIRKPGSGKISLIPKVNASINQAFGGIDLVKVRSPSITTAIKSVGNVKSGKSSGSKDILGHIDIPSIKGAAAKTKKKNISKNIENIVGSISTSTIIKKKVK